MDWNSFETRMAITDMIDPAAAVASLFEENIRNGVWSAGLKLPTERELERQFGVPRYKLRKLLKELEAAGKITRHVGRGSFVSEDAESGLARPPAGLAAHAGPTESGPPFGSAFTDLRDCIQGASPNAIMEVRLMIEPAAAELAAARATSQDLARIEDCHEKSLAADSIRAFEYWDGLLHREIVAAARNELLVGIYEAVNSARFQPEWAKMKERSVTPPRRRAYCDHHAQLVQALKDRDGKLARQVSIDHLMVVRANFFGE